MLVCNPDFEFWSSWAVPQTKTCYPKYGPDRHVVLRHRYCRSGSCSGESRVISDEKCKNVPGIPDENGEWSHFEGEAGCTKECDGGKWKISRNGKMKVSFFNGVVSVKNT